MIDHSKIDHDKVHKFMQEETNKGRDKYTLNENEVNWIKGLLEYLQQAEENKL